MAEKQRYSRLSDVIKLIMLMQSNINGVTIQDIQDEFKVSRRTAERMRNSIMNIIPNINEIESHDKIKRWGFTNYSFKEIINFSQDDIKLLEKIDKTVDSNNKLKNVITKIKALNNDNSFKNEIEFLLISEGIAIKPNPNYITNLDTINTIREGIKNGLKIRINYENKSKLIEPLGIILEEEPLLVARENEINNDIFLILLNKINDIKLTDKIFNSNGFNLKEFMKTYQEKNIKNENIIILFKENADVIQFNQEQKTEKLGNNSTKVRFKSPIDKTLLNKLFRCGDKINILAPIYLKDFYKDYLKNILNNI